MFRHPPEFPPQNVPPTENSGKFGRLRETLSGLAEGADEKLDAVPEELHPGRNPVSRRNFLKMLGGAAAGAALGLHPEDAEAAGKDFPIDWGKARRDAAAFAMTTEMLGWAKQKNLPKIFADMRQAFDITKGGPTRGVGDLEQIINLAAKATRLDSALIKAIISTESSWAEEAYDEVKCVAAAEKKAAKHGGEYQGSVGLMQPQAGATAAVNLTTRGSGGFRERCNPALNVLAGSRYIRDMINKAGGDVTRGLAMYNKGPAGNIDAGIRDYSSKVLTALYYLEQDAAQRGK